MNNNPLAKEITYSERPGELLLAWVPAKLLHAQNDLVGKVGLGGLSPENTIYLTGAVRTNQIVSAGFIR